MPTAAEYRDAARRYRITGEHLLREAAEIARWAIGFVAAGPVQDTIDESLRRTRGALVAAGDELTRIAAVCDARAEVCAEFARSVERYRHLTPVEQLLRRPPTRPARWVEL